MPELDQQTLPDGYRVVTATGDLDRTDLPELRRGIRAAFDGVDGVILDLAGVTYIDSSILAGLIAESLDADKRRNVLALVTGTGGIMRSLELKGLMEVLHIATTMADAMTMLGPAPGARGG